VAPQLLEKVVESDDTIMEKYLTGAELTETEFLTAIRKAVQGGDFFRFWAETVGVLWFKQSWMPLPIFAEPR